MSLSSSGTRFRYGALGWGSRGPLLQGLRPPGFNAGFRGAAHGVGWYLMVQVAHRNLGVGVPSTLSTLPSFPLLWALRSVPHTQPLSLGELLRPPLGLAFV